MSTIHESIEHVAYHRSGALSRSTCATCTFLHFGYAPATHDERLILTGEAVSA